MKKPSLFILPGWSEGPQQQRKFMAVAQKSGFRPASSPTNADVLVTHSGGCYLIPKENQAVVIMHIDPSYGLRGTLSLRQFQNIIFGLPSQIPQWGFSRLLRLRSWNLFNIVFRPSYNFKIFWLWLSDEVAAAPRAKVLLVHNLGDINHSAAYAKLKSVNKQASYVELPGLHEDCWFNPGPYIDLLLKEYNK